jgi:hypothetical protein
VTTWGKWTFVEDWAECTTSVILVQQIFNQSLDVSALAHVTRRIPVLGQRKSPAARRSWAQTGQPLLPAVVDERFLPGRDSRTVRFAGKLLIEVGLR